MARTLSILVLDDNAENADSLAELLSLDDHKVQVAYSGQEAIDVYTALLSDGSLFYVLGVAPREEYNVYSNVFRNLVRSIQLAK